MKGEINVAEALEQIKGSSIKIRSEGLANLRHIFRSTKSYDHVDDRSFHAIFETLFEITVSEQSTYLKSKTSTARTSAEGRLSACAGALRISVEAGLALLRLKTVKSVLDHVIDTMVLPSGQLCEPIALDYAKTMVALLGHQPHVEHLPQKRRGEIMSFCEILIQQVVRDLDEDEAESGAEKVSISATINGLSYRSSRSQFKDSADSQGGRSVSKQVAEQMVTCLASLTATLHVRGMRVITTVAATLIEFLKEGNQAHLDAFAGLNNILAWARSEDFALCRKLSTPIARLVKIYWPKKSAAAFKIEMLRALIYLQPFFASLLHHGDLTARSELQGLLDVLRLEYATRQDKDQMHLDDIRLTASLQCAEQLHRIHTGIFELRCGNARAEPNWFVVNIMATYCNLLTDDENGQEVDGDEDDLNPRPRKRLRTEDEFQRVLTLSKSGDVRSRLCSLQILAFAAQQKALSYERLTLALDVLSFCSAENNSFVASWALLALASLALQAGSKAGDLSSRWAAVWQGAIRAMSNTGSCRAACHLLSVIVSMELVSNHHVVELAHTVTNSVVLNGPTALGESTLRLLARILTIVQTNSPASASSAAENMLSWLFRNFVPSKFDDKAYAGTHSLFEPYDILYLIGHCLGQFICMASTPRYPVWDSLGHTWISCEDESALVRYLLLLPDVPDVTSQRLSQTPSLQRSTMTSGSCETTVLNFLINDLTQMQDTWAQLVQERPRSIGLDMFTFFCSAMSTSMCVAYCHQFRDSRRQQQLQKQVKDLLTRLIDFVPGRNCDQDKVDAMLLMFSSSCSGLVQSAPSLSSHKCERILCNVVHRICASRRVNEQIILGDDEDVLDMDAEYESQTSRRDDAATRETSFRSELAASSSIQSLRASMAMYCALISSEVQNAGNGHKSHTVSTSPITYITSLPPDSIISSRLVVSRLHDLGVDLSMEDAEHLLGHCTKAIFSAYHFERSEPAMGVVIDILSSIIPLWIDKGNSKLFGLGMDLYEWFTTKALANRLLSPRVQRRVATLLLRLCHLDQDYGQGEEDVPSVRTSLFEFLKQGCVAVLFQLSNTISSIFSLFVLASHEAMFSDLQESLTIDGEWPEGMAMRLLFFSRLASAWHSLLRPCVYYMFETAANVPISIDWAAWSMSELALALRFNSSRDLFHIFAPQLLFTWLEQKREVLSLPYRAVGYDSLSALIVHNQVEITAQLLVRANEQGLGLARSATNSTDVELYIRSFAKCAAYCIMNDVRKGPPAPGMDSTEARLRSAITKERYKALIVDTFPVIVAQFYLSMGHDDIQDAWLGQRKGYPAATKANAEMRSFSQSDRPLPTGQEPSYRSKFLPDHVERLCRRTAYNPAQPFDASSFSTVARILIDSIEPALGPLQACITIRKLRLLISLSGDVPLTEFPLEMLIHTLRPFASDGQCADDVIGVLQYLFKHGQGDLKANPSFLFGTATLTILRMRKHSDSRQESTTQESQHRQTIQRMQHFQAWLVGYLRECLPPSESSPSHAYANLAKALERVKLPGNGRKSTAESTLILLLVGKDGLNGLPLHPADRDEALKLLAEDFEAPKSSGEDCLEDASQCVKIVRKLWASMQIPGLSDNFVAWGASAIGRAYAYDGTRPYRELDDDHKKSAVSRRDQGSTASQAAIAQKLSEMLYSNDRSQASIADYTLRSIALSYAAYQEHALDFQQLLPNKMVLTIWPGTFGYVPDFAPVISTQISSNHDLSSLLSTTSDVTLRGWVQKISSRLCDHAPQLPLLPALRSALQYDPDLAHDLLPYMVHILLVHEERGTQSLRTALSTAAAELFAMTAEDVRPHQAYLLNLLLYLRKQRMPGEVTDVDRLRWLEIDWLQAARAADRCGLSTIALMLAESASQPQHGSRRSSSRAPLSQVPLSSMPQDLLLSIFKAIDEPDSFYGVEQASSITSVLERLDYEGDGYKSLMFRSARTDADVRRSGNTGAVNGRGVIQSLSRLNLDSISFALLSAGFGSSSSAKELMTSAQRLQRWDVAVPAELTHDPIAACFMAFKELSRATNREAAASIPTTMTVKHTLSTAANHLTARPSTEWLSALAVLAEADSLLKSASAEDLESRWEELKPRRDWMELAPFSDFRLIISGRQTLFNIIAGNTTLLEPFGSRTIRSIEIESLIELSSISREHSQLQEALSASNQLNEVVELSKGLGIKAELAAMSETALVLWEANEVVASVQLIRDALHMLETEEEEVSDGRSGLLAQLAHQLADARLEKPDDILTKYLRPAIKYLHDSTTGEEAGKVFHEFAKFCDNQLTNSSHMDDLTRIARLHQRKREEVEDLEKMSRGSRRPLNDEDYKRAVKTAVGWNTIYEGEYVRQKRIHDTFLQESLQNYLLALRASDKYDLSVLRFFALWLENSDTAIAGKFVGKYLPQVPSWKFVVLMNQLMSRLEHDNSAFQNALKGLAVRICIEHPYHSLHHLYASSRKPISKEQSADSRWRVANDIGKEVQNHAHVKPLLANVFKANSMYQQLAWFKSDDLPSTHITLNEIPIAMQVAKTVPGLKIPPVTISVTLRRDGVYSDIPVISRFRSSVRIMGGISKPKRLTALATDGREYVQLFKGRDDLRQDAIMEQVFGEVSKMLRNHKATRQRDLRVRTYLVIPLSNTSGVIEAVPNSMSLTEYLSSAHPKYYPHDMKAQTARERTDAVAKQGTEARVKEWRKICEHFHPVMRHFFFERFKDPDDWFAKRTAYTRTTAAISILGHVLGLGDRHCGNIMLDEKTGEIVHIDLGIAFEAGRILPIPEKVPFRLSRDVVDAMGVTKTEGVFRRCCEFTMDAIREDKDRVMTLLNVLRYDPLYEWTVSPTRAKQMQDESGRVGMEGEEASSRSEGQEAAEADRALSIVEKKLSKAMSTAATVNELIQQATDERNLATLFTGWTAYY